MQYGNSLGSGESDCPITRLLGQLHFFTILCYFRSIYLRTHVAFFYVLRYETFVLLDIVLYLCERGHVEGGMVFQLLEDLTEMSTIKDCKDIFGYIESQQDVLGKVIVICIHLI